MEVKQLKYFMQVCEDGSFSKASKNLYITQQGLSKAIRNLEEEINASLFYRVGNGSTLTEYGEYLKNESTYIIKELDRISDGIKKIANGNEGKIKIGASFGVISSISYDIITEFQSIYPNIELDIREYPDLKCEEAVLKGEVDLGFTIADVDKNLFNSKIIKTEKLCALVNEKNPLSKNTEIDFQNLKNEKIISINKEFKLYHNFVNKCIEHGFKPDIVLTTQEMILVHNLSRLNKGIGISVYFFMNDIANVKVIPFKDPSFSWQICLITKKERFMPNITKRFIDYILNMNL